MNDIFSKNINRIVKVEDEEPEHRPIHNSSLQTVFYTALFVLLFISSAMFFYSFWDTTQFAWDIFKKMYFFGLLVYTWHMFLLLFWSDVQQKNVQAYDGGKITVIIPCYNEDPYLLSQSIKSVVRARGNKEIIIINDGSTNNITSILDRLAKKYNIHVHHFAKNRGKRHALWFAIKKLVSEDTAYIVTIDSDTVIDKKALVHVVAPLQNKKVGAATSDIRVLNEKDSVLTRMVAAYYWVSLNLHRRAKSSLGIVDCCSGALAAYKMHLIKPVIDDFVNQYFLGEPCTFSEDRHLTNLILKQGFKVVYTSNAVVYTYSPGTIKGFLKQQQRWKRGFIRESTYTLSYAWKNNKILFAQVFLWDLTSPFISFGLRVFLVLTIVFSPKFFIISILPNWILFLVVRNIFVILHAHKHIPGLLMYVIFYELVLYWANIYALFTVKTRSWVTR